VAGDQVTNEPDDGRDMFVRGAAAKARRHGRLLTALGAVNERDPDDQAGDEGEREPPQAPAA
jgi:hypothetical protein